MTEIILVRHGETAWNAQEIFRGRIDIELNQTGVKQAELLAEYLGKRSLTAILSSPLQRAVKTAELINGYQKPDVEIVPELIDMDFGEWQGLSHQDVKDRYQALYTEWINHPDRVRMPSGESLDDVGQRARKLVDDVIAKYEGTVALVSHRVVNKVLICALLGLDNSRFWQIKQDTCAISTFYCDRGYFILTEHNNTSFLRPLPPASLSDF